ncbi:MAG: hypothetical protein ACEQSA_00155 [Weeksellaceae bacterium]
MKKVILLSLFTLILSLPSAVNAESISARLVPNKYQIIAKPGASITLPYTIYNLGDPTTYMFEIRMLASSDNQATLQTINCPAPSVTSVTCEGFDFTLSNGNSMFTTPFLMYADDAQAGELTIQVPTTSVEQDYYFSFNLKQETIAGLQGSSTVILKPVLAAPISISVSNTGKLNQKITIPSLQLKDTQTISFLGKRIVIAESNRRLPLSLTIANTGSHLASVSGTLKVNTNQNIVDINPISIPAESQISLEIPHDFTGLLGWLSFTTQVQTADASQTVYAAADVLFLPLRLLGIFCFIFFCVGLFILHKYVKK